MRTEIEKEIEEQLFALQDIKYKEFQCKLMPTVDPDTVIGVRTPELRKLAKSYSKRRESEDFLKILPHRYYEENNLHGFLLEKIKDFDQAVGAVEAFLPYVNNWATCDMMSPKILGRHLPELYEKIKQWIKSTDTYTVRFAIGMLMRYYLDEDFRPEYPELVSRVKSQEYYINMMIAWYFATALAKQYDAVLMYFEEDRLDKWVHNKSIQKALESYRITEDQKTYLRTLKR